jgi:GntR family transcriptional regulator
MLLAINEQDPRPIYTQIASEIKEQIRTGSLRPGDELPSVRELAQAMGINLHTVHHAYQKLRDQGVITLRLGRRGRVAPLRRNPVASETLEATLAPRLKELITEAYHLGLSPRDFRDLVNDLLDTGNEGGARP